MWVESGNENMIYVASGKQVKSFDVRLVIINPPLSLYVFVFSMFLLVECLEFVIPFSRGVHARGSPWRALIITKKR